MRFLVAWRFKEGRRLRDPLVAAVALFSTINAALAMGWEWLGT